MATPAQIAANRRNAQASTGPRSPEGKIHSAANATKFGLFTAENYVRPLEQSEYDALTAALWADLAPAGAIEDMLAAEVVRCAWRLRRCVAAEASLVEIAQMHHDQKAERDPRYLTREPVDPHICQTFTQWQTAIDRARGQAQSCLRRAMADLASRQTERFIRLELPSSADPATLGLANIRQIADVASRQASRQQKAERAVGDHALNQLMQQLQADDQFVKASLAQFHQSQAVAHHAGNRHPRTDQPRAEQNEAAPSIAPAHPEFTERTQSAPPPLARNALCPCHSGQKYKRCCGRNAPAVLQNAA